VHPGHPLHKRALPIALAFATISALLQPLSGDLSAKSVARRQPAKLAAMEALYETQRGAPLLLGGIPDEQTESVRFGIEIPYALSVLAFADPHAEVRGLKSFPKDLRPPTLICHLAFQLMVGAGTLLSMLGLVYAFLRRRKRHEALPRWFLRAIALATPLGFLAVEAGWTVTEVGRQPFIIYGLLRTKDAASPMPGLVWPLLISLVVYAVLVTVVSAIMLRLIRTLEARSLDGGLGAIQGAEHG
jgi:cytochrome d ubiquinol oxidase subunit I